MKSNGQYELDLWEITSVEYGSHLDTFPAYTEKAVKLLKSKALFAFEEDVLMEQQEPEDFSQHPDRYIRTEVPYQKRQGKLTKSWYDLWTHYIIASDDEHYDSFFVLKLRHLDLLEIDLFLNYQLIKWYEDDVKKFCRFLSLLLRKHGKSHLSPEYIETVREWVTDKEKEIPFGVEAKAKTKGVLKREAEDNLTRLNQEQTALLIHYLQKNKVILKDEYLNNKQAGQAFSALTGYSADTLRQNLGKTELQRIASKKNLSDLHNILTRMGILISNDLAGKK